MYDWPEVRPSNERLWAAILAELRSSGVTETVTLEQPQNLLAHWQSETLLLSQTCGWPYANLLRGSVLPFARFEHDLDKGPPGTYHSVFIGQSKDDKAYIENAKGLKSCPTIAINSTDSQSGFQVFREILNAAPENRLTSDQYVISGAHRASIKMIADGHAHVAAIDAVAYALAERHDPELVADVEILGFSTPKPGLPLITSPRFESKTNVLFKALRAAVKKLDEADKDALLIRGVLPAEDSDYEIYLSSQNA